MTAAGKRLAVIVVDLGFGDAGKGLLTDHLVRRLGARAVVRWNGGAQAGHNVVTPDGRHHTFAQIGAGAFVPGVRTLLSRHVVVHPTGLGLEARHLGEVGVADALERTTASESIRIISPFQQATGRIRELVRGAARHGSCGIGVGETVHDSLVDEEAVIRLGELARSDVRAKLRRLRDRKRATIDALLSACSLDSGFLGGSGIARELSLFDDVGVIDRFTEATRAVLARVNVVGDEAFDAEVARSGRVVLEGAQGVLLDEWRGFHPFTTWSACTTEPARALLEPSFDPRAIKSLGVLRTFATRHGEGPFPTESRAMSARFRDPHNVEGPWQGPLRVGMFDAVLGRYALEVSGGVDGIALTHVDAVPRFDPPSLASAYRVDASARRELVEVSPLDSNVVVRIRPADGRDLAHQEALASLLDRVEPIVTPTATPDADAFLAHVEEALACGVVLTSEGATSDHVRVRCPGFFAP